MKLPIIELYLPAHTPTHINRNCQCPCRKRRGQTLNEIMINFTRLEKITIIQSERDWSPDWTFTDQMDIKNTKASELSGEDKE